MKYVWQGNLKNLVASPRKAAGKLRISGSYGSLASRMTSFPIRLATTLL
jgi:hypothetical protein